MIVEYSTVSTNLEMVSCIIHFTDGSFISVASIYLPPVPFNVSYATLNNCIRQMKEPRMILGDFNAHGVDWGGQINDARSQALVAVFDDNHLATINTGAMTRIAPPPNRSSALDLSVCSTIIALSCTWEVLDACRSDHLPILINYNKTPNITSTIRPRSLTKHIDWTMYRHNINEQLRTYEHTNPNYNEFIAAVLMSVINAQTKPLHLNVGGQSSARCPKDWWNADLQQLYNEKKEAFRRFKRIGGQSEYLEFKRTEAQFQRAKRKSKRTKWREFCSSVNKDTPIASLYAMAKRYRGQASTQTRYSLISENWLPSFCEKLAPPTVPVKPRSFVRETPSGSNSLSQPFDMIEFEAALEGTSNTSAGLDRIHFAMLRELPVDGKKVLLQIYNRFLETSEFPDDWYDCKVVAIPKPNRDPHNHTSYRPICLLSCPRKLFEKLIHTRIDFWAEQHKRISPSQFGFRKGFGTQECLAILASDLEHTFANKAMTICVFMDISAAYDDVLIDVLCDALEAMQLNRQIISIIEKLFYKRNLIFSYNDIQKERRTGYRGLAQGSSLSPLLYNLYTASIEKVVPQSVRILQYADDVAVYFEGQSGPLIQKEMQCVLTRLSNAYNKLGLTISTTKTEFMVFTRKYTIPTFRLRLNNSEIKQVAEFKYLGVVFDRKCKWKSQSTSIIRKCGKRVNFLKTIAGSSWGAHPSCLLLLYKNTIRSIIDYGSQCFQHLAKTHRIKIERIQWRAIRICLGLMTSTHTRSCEVLAGIIPLPIRWNQLSQKLLLKSSAGPNQRLRESFEKLSSISPNHQIIVNAQIIFDLPIQSCNTFPCYQAALKSNIYAPTVSWTLRNELRRTPDATSAEVQHIANSCNISDAIYVYTDGSRSEFSTGAAAYMNESRSKMLRLNEPSNVFNAELEAVAIACSLIQETAAGQYIIAADSMSVITALQSRRITPIKSTLFYSCKRFLYDLHQQGKEVVLTWVPAHRGIAGNESADTLAKRATIISEYSTMEPEWQMFTAMLASTANSKWQQQWSAGELGRFCHSIVPSVSNKPWFEKYLGDLQRPIIRMASRIASNHTCLRDHLNRINIIDEPFCQYCETNEFETIDHVLFNCTKFEQQRIPFIQTLTRKGFIHPLNARDILALNINTRILEDIYNFTQLCEITI